MEKQQSVIFSVTTDEEAGCILNLDNDFDTFNMETSDNLTHTYSKNLNTNKDYIAYFNCTDSLGNLGQENVAFTYLLAGSGGGDISPPSDDDEVFAGTIVNTTILEVVGESNETFSAINLTSLVIRTNKFCKGEGDLIFDTIGTNGEFTIIDSAEMLINGKKQNNILKKDLTNENYLYSLEGLEEDEIEVNVKAFQNGKEVSETKTISNGNCFDSENYLENVVNKFVNLIQQNKTVVMFIVLGILALALVSYLVYKLK